MPTWISGSYKLADQIANTQTLMLIGAVMRLINTKKINQANGSHKLFKSSCYTCHHLVSFLLHRIQAYGVQPRRAKTLKKIPSEATFSYLVMHYKSHISRLLTTGLTLSGQAKNQLQNLSSG